ncbi:hypothetical protein X975_12853, partial [Stegodyphus mimosarum]
MLCTEYGVSNSRIKLRSGTTVFQEDCILALISLTNIGWLPLLWRHRTISPVFSMFFTVKLKWWSYIFAHIH